MKVLIVDDEAFLAELVKLALEADGHASFAVRNVDEASEVLRSLHVDLVAIDLAAAGANPLPWLEETILAHPELHGRVFVLSGSKLDSDDALRLVSCGARIMAKPLTLQQMRETVQAMAPFGGPPAAHRPRGPAIEA